MRKTAWIWAVGCLVWVFDAGAHIHTRQWGDAALGFLMAVLFFVAWVFFRKRR